MSVSNSSTSDTSALAARTWLPNVPSWYAPRVEPLVPAGQTPAAAGFAALFRGKFLGRRGSDHSAGGCVPCSKLASRLALRDDTRCPEHFHKVLLLQSVGPHQLQNGFLRRGGLQLVAPLLEIFDQQSQQFR